MTTYALTDDCQARVVCRVATGEIFGSVDAKGGYTKQSNLARCESGDRFVVSLAMLSNAITGKANGQNGYGLSIAQCEGQDYFVFAFDDPRMMAPTVVSGEVIVSGGVPAVLDGRRCTEYGFHYPPCVSSVLTWAGLGGKLDDLGVDTYWQACVVYKWIDSAGIIHRSPPSLPVTGSGVSGSISSDYFYFPVYNLTLTERDDLEDGTLPVTIELYRTVGNGTTFYLEHEYTNAKDAPTTTVSPGLYLSDALIAESEVLYSDGGGLLNWQPPAARHVVAHGAALWLISAERPTELWFSKDINDFPRAAGFDPQTRVIRHDPGGEFVALASLDDKLICFKRAGIYAIVGEPANDLAQGGSLRGPIDVSVQTGCIELRSVVSCPAGVVFQGSKTIWLLDRGLSCKPIGDAIEDTLANYPVVTSAIHDDLRGLVLLTLTSIEGTTGYTAAWDYQADAWMLWSFPDSSGEAGEATVSAAVVPRGAAGVASDTAREYHMLQGNGSVRYLDTDLRTDDGATAVAMVASTAWIQFAGLQGFQRVARLEIHGTWLSAHGVSVAIYYDFESSAAQTVTFSTAQIAALLNGTSEQFEIQLDRQKCSAVRAVVTATPDATPGTCKCVRWESIAFRWGNKQGLNRKPEVARR